MSMRLDKYLVEENLASSRQRAQDLIKGGHVKVGDVVMTKPAAEVDVSDKITLLKSDLPYVSRAALKLKALLEAVEVNLMGAIVLDVGASTGGFTQVCLEEGSHKVYALDVGTGQLKELLKGDPRVVNMAQTDARDIQTDMFDPVPTVLVSDVSFISVTKALDVALRILPIERLFVLIKPQFELSPHQIGKGGLVKDEAAQKQAVEKVEAFVHAHGFETGKILPSPVKGGDGNQEYLLYATRGRE